MIRVNYSGRKFSNKFAHEVLVTVQKDGSVRHSLALPGLTLRSDSFITMRSFPEILNFPLRYAWEDRYEVTLNQIALLLICQDDKKMKENYKKLFFVKDESLNER